MYLRKATYQLGLRVKSSYLHVLNYNPKEVAQILRGYLNNNEQLNL